MMNLVLHFIYFQKKSYDSDGFGSEHFRDREGRVERDVGEDVHKRHLNIDVNISEYKLNLSTTF
jgi:hypothetical protein